MPKNEKKSSGVLFTGKSGLELFYRGYASREAGTPVLCLHGFMRNSRDFEELAPRLAASRLAIFCSQVKSVFEGYRTRLNPAAEKNNILGHACGTFRFGELPHNSVLDRNSKAHELDNLYVVDSYFFLPPLVLIHRSRLLQTHRGWLIS